MNPLKFHGSKVDENPQEFIDEVYKVLSIIGVNSKEKMELVAYQLNGVAQVWFTQWKMERGNNNAIPWEEFKAAFLNLFFPIELREDKMMEFMNLKQGSMSVRGYALKLNQLSRYAP
ncbi:MAG: retrotransposon gag domain-containing protein [Candidatus Phytoplasma australasiaticum]|nr:retrotransposon gag domain-containing protein [Candidatus Phytoplasma australasiaticum]